MEVDKIEAFDYMLHLFEEWRDNHETIKGKPFPKLTAMKLLFLAACRPVSTSYKLHPVKCN